MREERTASFEKSTVPSSSVISKAPGLWQAHVHAIQRLGFGFRV